jgi:23S rRNA pseudouridine1911/1915/1917 synthase
VRRRNARTHSQSFATEGRRPLTEQHFVYEFEITEALHGRRLRSILHNEYKFSTRMLRSLIRHQGVLKNGAPAYLKQPVAQGDKIRVMLPKEYSEIPPEPMEIDVCYEDREIVVVNKPSGVLTHPSAKDRTRSMLAAVAHHVQAEGAVPHCVHRLDRDTSGVVMFAKHAHIHHLFDIALRENQMHRTYVALVWHRDAFVPLTPGEWQTIDLPIGVDPHQPSRRIISASGQRAVTHFRIVGQTDEVSAVQIQLETGRTHQIRLHLSTVGLPLVGDPVYGHHPAPNSGPSGQRDNLPIPFKRQALHAVHLTWRHPVTGVENRATAPVAEDIKQLWDALGGNPNIWTELESSVPQLLPRATQLPTVER